MTFSLKKSHSLSTRGTWNVMFHSLDPDRNSNVTKVTKNTLNKSICGRKNHFFGFLIYILS